MRAHFAGVLRRKGAVALDVRAVLDRDAEAEIRLYAVLDERLDISIPAAWESLST